MNALRHESTGCFPDSRHFMDMSGAASLKTRDLWSLQKKNGKTH